MLGPLIVLFLVLPFIDIYLLIELTGRIGFLNTLLVVLATGMIGAAIVKREGKGLLQKLQRSVTAEEVSRNVMEAVLLGVGGLMMITPGLVTDFLGLLMVWRPTRVRIMLKLAEKIKKSGNFQVEVQRF